MATDTHHSPETQSAETQAMKQTLIWVGVVILVVAALTYVAS